MPSLYCALTGIENCEMDSTRDTEEATGMYILLLVCWLVIWLLMRNQNLHYLSAVRPKFNPAEAVTGGSSRYTDITSDYVHGNLQMSRAAVHMHCVYFLCSNSPSSEKWTVS